jgi:hypothetical protein
VLGDIITRKGGVVSVRALERPTPALAGSAPGDVCRGSDGSMPLVCHGFSFTHDPHSRLRSPLLFHYSSQQNRSAGPTWKPRPMRPSETCCADEVSAPSGYLVSLHVMRSNPDDKPTTRRMMTEANLMLQQRQCNMCGRNLRKKNGPSICTKCSERLGKILAGYG